MTYIHLSFYSFFFLIVCLCHTQLCSEPLPASGIGIRIRPGRLPSSLTPFLLYSLFGLPFLFRFLFFWVTSSITQELPLPALVAPGGAGWGSGRRGHLGCLESNQQMHLKAPCGLAMGKARALTPHYAPASPTLL